MNATVVEKTVFCYANAPVAVRLPVGAQFGVGVPLPSHSQVLRVVLESRALPAATSACSTPFFYSERVVFLPPPAPMHFFSVQLANQTTVDASDEITLHERAERRGGARCERR